MVIRPDIQSIFGYTYLAAPNFDDVKNVASVPGTDVAPLSAYGNAGVSYTPGVAYGNTGVAYTPGVAYGSLPASPLSPGVRTALILASIASAGASAYHGYKRNDSVGWALWWGFMGTLAPVITPAIALAQGFGKRKA